MKKNILLPILLLISFVLFPSIDSKLSWSHGNEESSVEIRLDQTEVQAGRVLFVFNLFDKEKKKYLSELDLNIVHEKKLHLFIYDAALKEFRHEHPVQDGKWQVEVTLPVNGEYWFWVQGQITEGKRDFTSPTVFDVVGGENENPLPQLGDEREGSDGLSQLTLSLGKITAKKEKILTLTVSRTDGTPPHLTPFLGEYAHVISTPSDGDTLIHLHAHPMHGHSGAKGSPTHLMLHVNFPAAGKYRIWVQFVDGGLLRTIPLSVIVFSTQ